MGARENKHAVREIYAAFGRGDVRTILDRIGDKVDWYHHGPPGVIPWAKERHTKDEVASFFQELGGAVDVVRFEPTTYVAEGDKVVALGVFEARVKANGRAFSEHWAMEWTFRDGRVVQYRAYDDTEAIAAAFRG